MSKLGDYLENCFINGHIDLKKVMERCSVSFDNLSLDDVGFVESELRELCRKFEDAEKVDCFRTYKLQSIGFGNEAYFTIDEADIVKALSKESIDEGFWGFTVEKVRISKEVLNGHIRDRKEWEHK